MSIPCTIRIDDDKHNELVKLAKANKRSKAFYIKEALNNYLFDRREAEIEMQRKNGLNEKFYTTEEMLEKLKA